MERETTTPLVLQPGTDFHAIEQSLAGLDWQRQAGDMAQPPLIPGEPELAAWLRADGAARLSYSFNPVVKLRVLSFAGTGSRSACQDVARRLPTLGLEDLRRLLASNDMRELLLAIFAAVELDAFTVLPRLDELRSHQDDRVARAADDAQMRLSQRMVALGVEQLVEEQERHPDRSALFPNMGSVQERRQMLRWLAQDFDSANADMAKVLRTALADPDWEIRVTAMLVAARLGVRELVLNVRRMPLPQTSHEGLDREDRGLLLALQKAAVAELADEAFDEQVLAPGAAPIGKQAMWVHLRRCVKGGEVSVDQASLWVRALTTPVPIAEDMLADMPVGIIREQGQWRLAVSGLELCWVAGIEHWLGEAVDSLPSPNPPRRLRFAPGFFIAKQPVSAAQWQQWMGSDAAGRAEGWDVAQSLCVRLAQLEGLAVQLPSADQWEMASRGPDGRRHPWGMGIEEGWRDAASPWGLRDCCTGPEWVMDDDTAWLYGHDRYLRCAARVAALESGLAGELAAVRPVVLVS